ncbi:6257_t:CDS:1, partial [Gigaspora rosea]
SYFIYLYVDIQEKAQEKVLSVLGDHLIPIADKHKLLKKYSRKP